MTKRPLPEPRSLQEWMERTGTTGERLRERIARETGVNISATMFSFILRGSRRCSRWNAAAISEVTGVPVKTLIAWPRISESDNSSGGRPKRVA